MLLLFFMPFLFKYLIVINDALVDIIRVNSKYSVHAYYTFEHMYDALGGQEDGENSTTSILERLKDARKYTEEEIKKLEKKLDKHKENLKVMQDAYSDMLENGKDSQLGKLTLININNNKQILNKNLSDNGWKIYKNGKEKTIDSIENDLSDIFTKFYSNKENRDNLLSLGSLEAIINELSNIKNEDFKNEIDKYCDSIKIASSKDEKNQLDKKEIINECYMGIYGIGHWVMVRDCYDIFIDAREENLNNINKEKQDIEQEIKNINIAINKIESNDADIMGDMRTRADNTGRFFFVAVWFVLVFEVILLLVLYYKRLFMLMILIAIFPLVTVAYVYEKSKGEKAKILKNWTQEYIVNVFIQSIHAILYVTLVEAGYSVYIGNNDNWIIFIMAVIALITVEPIFKHILGLNSSTVMDLAKYGTSSLKVAASAAAVTSIVASTGKDLKNIDNKGKNKEADIKKKQERNDKKQRTLRQYRDNKIKQDNNLTKEQKEKKLKAKADKDGKRDNRKDWLRKKMMSDRKNARKLKKINRVAKNITAVGGAVAGGLAAGGGLDDFMTAAGISKALHGIGGKGVDLTDDAKKIDKENSKVNSENSLANVSSENSNSNTNYSGASYDNYGYSSSGGESGQAIDEGMNNSKNWRDSKVATTFAQRLEEEKVYVNKKYNIKEEDE